MQKKILVLAALLNFTAYSSDSCKSIDTDVPQKVLNIVREGRCPKHNRPINTQVGIKPWHDGNTLYQLTHTDGSPCDGLIVNKKA